MYKALIIDDEKPVQIAILRLGSWNRYHIMPPETAANGKEALSAMRELRPDICFVDMQMPMMNGAEFLEQASAEFPNAQYIIVSGYDDFKYARSAIKFGACDYLLKPIVQEELNKAIEKAILRINPHADFSIQESQSDVPPEEVVRIIKEYLSKLFKSKYGCGIYTYVQEIRMQRARDLLLNPDIKIQSISERLGYADNNYFSKAFKNYYGMSPSQFRKKNGPDNQK